MLLNLSLREAFAVTCLRHLGEVVVWGQLDCSELVALGEIVALGVDRRRTHTAAMYAARNGEDVVIPELGDLGFFGQSWATASHVVIATYGGQILSADGATSTITDYASAVVHPRARVRLHPDISWYRSAPWLGWRRHHELDHTKEQQ